MKKIIILAIISLFIYVEANAGFFTWRYREHATDCTSLTDGKNTDLCFEQDDDTVYKCDPTSGDCDTTAEWKLIGGVPAGSNTQIQYNNSGSFGASANLTYDGSIFKVTDGGSEPTYPETADIIFADTSGGSDDLIMYLIAGSGGGESNQPKIFFGDTSDADAGKLIYNLRSIGSDFFEFYVDGVAGASMNLYPSGMRIGNIVSASPDARLHLETDGTGTIGQIIDLAAGQTADAINVDNSSGTTLFKVAADGDVTTPNITISGLDCTGNANGGALTADASGVVSCTDDDTGGAAFDHTTDFSWGTSGSDLTISMAEDYTSTGNGKIIWDESQNIWIFENYGLTDGAAQWSGNMILRGTGSGGRSGQLWLQDVNTSTGMVVMGGNANYNYISAVGSSPAGLFFHQSNAYIAPFNHATTFHGGPGTFRNNLIELGQSSYRFKNFYSVLGNFSGALTLSSDVLVGSDLGGRVNIDGSADERQLHVQGHSTQTNEIALFEKSDGTDIFRVTNTHPQLTPVTVSALGTATAGMFAVVSDAADSTDCTTGSGSTYNLCIANGSAWIDA